ncbi:MAG: cytochrome c3 family protein [Gemmatimonadota bacterium]|jgi:hypothetical protein
MISRIWIPLLFAVVAMGSPALASAQLLSPGKLASAHGDLEGLRNCTSCHELGRRGVSPEKCLSCHEAIDARVRAGEGYHATVDRDDCASCHQDHLGEGFQLVRLDESAFDHASVGYALEQSHADVRCRDCHAASNVTDPTVSAFKSERGAIDRTYLGLSASCVGCHTSDSPHGDQFGTRTCAECHDPGAWEEPVGFDHAMTAFPLEGLHARVSCASCHGSGEGAQYAGLAYGTCAGCHDDPHGDAMQGSCSGCHQVTGWQSLRSGSVEGRFDHNRTSFALHGAHAAAECAACHRPGRPPRGELVRMTYQPGTATNSYPRPLADSCFSCHVDRHAASTAATRWTRCDDCHADSAWRPSDYGVARHADTEFPLTGAHLATPCAQCHGPAAAASAFPLAVSGRACVDCHEGGEDHERYADRTCESCHTTEAFDDLTFDHALVVDELGGCSSCHADRDPHAGQFEGSDCGSCHVTEHFEIDSFDHAQTAFPLDGAHNGVDCASCHRSEGSDAAAFVRYRPLGTECVDCHGGDR